MKNYRFLWVIILVLAGYQLATWMKHRPSPGQDQRTRNPGWQLVKRDTISLRYWDDQNGGLQPIGEFPPGEYRITADGIGEIYFWDHYAKTFSYKVVDPTGLQNYSTKRDSLVPKARIGSLVGQVGNYIPFPIGKEATFRVFSDEGSLPLRIGVNFVKTSRESYERNRGAFSITIERRL